MATYRERREARAERLEGWADKREQRGTAAVDRAHQMADAIPFGQPMLTDHHSYGRDVNYRNRIHSTFGRGFADLAKADQMRSRAANITAQADRAIYSDDADAYERLEQRIAELTAERDRIKAFNKSCKLTPGGDLSLLDDKQRAGWQSVARHSAYSLGKRGEMPGYELSNLSANIRKQQQRLEQLQRKAGATD